MKPQAWISIPLPKPHELPGYAEAVAKLERGESLFPKPAKRPTPVRRPLSALVAQRDRLSAQLAQFDGSGPVDTAAARLDQAGMRRHYKHTDAQLARYTALRSRLGELEAKILRHPQAHIVSPTEPETNGQDA